MTYEKIKKNYDRGFWSAQMVQMAVTKGVITQAQYEAIVSGAEVSEVDALLQEVSNIGY